MIWKESDHDGQYFAVYDHRKACLIQMFLFLSLLLYAITTDGAIM
jgi:hypothetical protein